MDHEIEKRPNTRKDKELNKQFQLIIGIFAPVMEIAANEQALGEMRNQEDKGRRYEMEWQND